MKPAVICTVVALLLPGSAVAQFRRQPSPLPRASVPSPGDVRRGGWDTRVQDTWDRALRHCLNDRHQTRHERRDCANQGMPPRR